MQTTPSLPVLLFSIALAIVTGAIFATAPAVASARANPIDALRGLAREGADRSFVPRRSLLVVQVTLSLVLLAGAGLLSKSLSRLENQPLGFDPSSRLVAYIDPPKLAGVLLVDFGDLMEPCRTGDHLINCLAQMRLEQRAKFLQHAARTIVDHVVRKPGSQFRSDGRQRHCWEEPWLRKGRRNIPPEWLSEA